MRYSANVAIAVNRQKYTAAAMAAALRRLADALERCPRDAAVIEWETWGRAAVDESDTASLYVKFLGDEEIVKP